MAQQLTKRGFNVWDVPAKRWMSNIQQMLELLNSNKIKNYETIVEGFEATAEALKSLIQGGYKGRVVVKV